MQFGSAVGGVAISISLLVGPLVVAADEPPPIRRRISNFTLKDYRGKSTSLDDFQGQSVVVAFLGTECPLAKLYAPRLAQLAKAYEPKGVAFLAIDANRQDSITEMEAYVRKHGIQFPFLKDVGNKVADEMGARRTPEVFLLDSEHIVQYHGRVNDAYGVGFARSQATRADLAIALNELLSGKPVSQPETKPVGCLIGRIREPNPDSAVTYSNQIARLLQKRCVECHRPGDIAPFSLTNYDEVVGWADMIDEVVHQRRMPPWHANPDIGHFANDRSLADDELQLIRDWVVNGAPEGDPHDLPEPLKFTEGWQLPRKPDLVLNIQQRPINVPAEGAVRYQYFTVDPGFTEDKWVASGEIVPGNRAVVHHIMMFVQKPGYTSIFRALQDCSWAYLPGNRIPEPVEGFAKRIPAGSKFVFQVHYTPIGTPQQDLSRVGLVFADPADVKLELRSKVAYEMRFHIPPRRADYRVEATSSPITEQCLLWGFTPHMHQRGKSFRYEVIWPDGRKEVVLDVPNYDFNWQTNYILREPLPLPPGTRVHCIGHFDNGVDNPRNPDPNASVSWGEQTWEEMMIGYFFITVPAEPNSSTDNQAASLLKNVDKRTQLRAAQMLAAWDRNHDELLAAKEIPRNFRRTLMGFDADGDKSLSFEELAIGLSRLKLK